MWFPSSLQHRCKKRCNYNKKNVKNVTRINKKLSCCCDSRSYRVQIRSPHTSARTLQSGSLGTRPNGTVPTHSRRKKRCNCVPVLGLRFASFFVVHFVAKRYILEQKCQKGRIGTLMLGTRWYNFYRRTPTLRATMHSVTDRQTDNRPLAIADHTV